MLGTSVTALASGKYFKVYFFLFLVKIDRHIILSSAKYLLASSHVASALLGSRTNYKYSSSNIESLIADHLYAEKAPGSTDINPKNPSNPLSIICPIVYSNNWAFSAFIIQRANRLKKLIIFNTISIGHTFTIKAK